MRKIVTGKDTVVLRKKAKKAESAKVGLSLIRDMLETLASTEHGIGLAAPQVGENVRVFVISPEFSEEADGHLVFINPKITRRSRKKVEEEEGCLSLPDTWGTVERSQKVTIKAHDEKGKKFKIVGKGLLARLFQHEVDHLEGTLFIDHIKK